MIIIINENSEWEPNSMQKKLYLYLSGSAFLVSFTDPNKQLANVKSVFEFPNWVPSAKLLSDLVRLSILSSDILSYFHESTRAVPVKYLMYFLAGINTK